MSLYIVVSTTLYRSIDSVFIITYLFPRIINSACTCIHVYINKNAYRKCIRKIVPKTRTEYLYENSYLKLVPRKRIEDAYEKSY